MNAFASAAPWPATTTSYLPKYENCLLRLISSTSAIFTAC